MEIASIAIHATISVDKLKSKKEKETYLAIK